MVEFFDIILSRPLRGSLSRTLYSPSTPVSGQRGERSLPLTRGPLAVRSKTTCWEEHGEDLAAKLFREFLPANDPRSLRFIKSSDSPSDSSGASIPDPHSPGYAPYPPLLESRSVPGTLNTRLPGFPQAPH